MESRQVGYWSARTGGRAPRYRTSRRANVAAFRAERAATTTNGGRHKEDTVAQTYEGYCVKCKEKRSFEGEVAVSKTGMEMAKGKCPTCGTTVNRILGKAKAKA